MRECGDIYMYKLVLTYITLHISSTLISPAFSFSWFFAHRRVLF